MKLYAPRPMCGHCVAVVAGTGDWGGRVAMAITAIARGEKWRRDEDMGRKGGGGGSELTAPQGRGGRPRRTLTALGTDIDS